MDGGSGRVGSLEGILGFPWFGWKRAVDLDPTSANARRTTREIVEHADRAPHESIGIGLGRRHEDAGMRWLT